MSGGVGLLRWPGGEEWIASIRSRLVRVAGAGIFARFRAFPPGAHRAYDEPWLPRVLGAECRVAPGELVAAISTELQDRYRAVRAYHAGRPVDPNAYLRRGLLLATPERLLTEAEEVFEGEEAALAALLPLQDLSLVDGQVSLHLDERYLLRSFTFYCLYGSHFLLGLAYQLERETGRSMRERLRARGVPTLAACDVPLDRLSAAALRQLCCQGIRFALAVDLEQRGGEPDGITNFEFTLDRPLPPEAVVSCRHPEGLTDVLAGGDEAPVIPPSPVATAP